MKKCRVVNVKTSKYDIYIGRGTIWGNLFHIGRDGTRTEVIRKYKVDAIKNKVIMQNLHKLVGKALGCHCKPLACHGDVLVKFVNALKKPKRKRTKHD